MGTKFDELFLISLKMELEIPNLETREKRSLRKFQVVQMLETPIKKACNVGLLHLDTFGLILEAWQGGNIKTEMMLTHTAVGILVVISWNGSFEKMREIRIDLNPAGLTFGVSRIFLTPIYQAHNVGRHKLGNISWSTINKWTIHFHVGTLFE